MEGGGSDFICKSIPKGMALVRYRRSARAESARGRTEKE